MTIEQRPWPRVKPWRRWGPVTVVLAVVVAAGVVATVHTTDRGQSSVHAIGNPAANPELPITYAEAKKDGTTAKYDWPKGCDRKTGRLAMPTVYSPPCVAVHHGDNGGATGPGVTADTITVAFYQPPPGDLASALTAQLDPPAKQWETAQKIAEMFNNTYELSGRKVKLVRFQGSGISTDETAARADAIKVADDIHAFASINGPAQTSAYEDELAARGVLCVGCGLSVTDADFQRNAPYMWGNLATPDQLLQSVFDYVLYRLKGQKATHAGSAAMRRRPRVFGTVHYEQDPPVFKDLSAKIRKKYSRLGLHSADDETYLLDLARLPDEASTIIGHLKAKKVTTVLFIGDPIMPMYLTKAATKQNYFPEWIVTGTVLTDTTTLGRLYDQRQWAHAFGVSSLAAATPPKQRTGRLLYNWYFGKPPAAPKTVEVLEAPLGELFLGLHMAGPHLTAKTFEGGMFRYPVSGGGPTNPQVSYGRHGFFPAPDFVGVDDTTEIWWDASATGPDEQGKMGKGMYRYANGGRRYLPGHIPHRPSDAFKRPGSVLMYRDPSQLPPSDRPPKVPPWPGSPAAK